MAKPVEDQFQNAFARKAAKVRTHLSANLALSGAAIGLVAGLGTAALLWWQRMDHQRPLAAALALVGAAVGWWLGQRSRWSDGEVALYLDSKLNSDESITTAVDLRARHTTKPDEAQLEVQAAVIDQANAALNAPLPKGMWPKVLERWHSAAALALGGIIWISLIALPPAPQTPPPPPGSDVVQLDEVPGLDKLIEEIDAIEPRDEAQRQRLKQLRERAVTLKKRLQEGMERREAQNEIAELRDAIAEERNTVGSGNERRGLEAALSKMRDNAELNQASRALGDRDLKQFDEEMDRVANRLNEAEREQAKQTLQEAAEAARKQGAESVAKALEEQAEAIERRGREADQLRSLAEAAGDKLSAKGKQALDQMNRDGSPDAKRELAQEVAKALEQMSDSEKADAAEKLQREAKEKAEQAKQQAKEQTAPPDGTEETGEKGPSSQQQSAEELEQLAQKLKNPGTQQQISEALRQMAEQPATQPSEASRQEQLRSAEEALANLEKQLSDGDSGRPGDPAPNGSASPTAGASGTPGDAKPGGAPGDAKPGGAQTGGAQTGGAASASPAGSTGSAGAQGSSSTPGGSSNTLGSGPGGGAANHTGFTNPLDARTAKTRVDGRLNPGRSNDGIVVGRTAPRVGETANQVGTGALGVVGPGEVTPTGERSDVPPEYQGQVNRYFLP